MYFLVFHNNANSQDSAKSIIDKYGSLNLLINASGVLSIPNVMQPGILFLCFVLIHLSILDWTLLRLIMMKQIDDPSLSLNYRIGEVNHLSSLFFQYRNNTE